jgi:hypothetical protein
VEPGPALPRGDVIGARVDRRVERAEALGHRLDALVGDAGGSVEALGLREVARAHGVGERVRPHLQVGHLRVHVAVVAAHGGGELGVGRGARGLSGYLEHALWRPLAAPDLVAAGVEVEREAAREALGDVLLLAEDAVALQALELGRLAGALVRGLERRRAGRDAQLQRRAAGVGELDRDLAPALVLVVLAARGQRDRGQRGDQQGEVPHAVWGAGARGRDRCGQST